MSLNKPGNYAPDGNESEGDNKATLIELGFAEEGEFLKKGDFIIQVNGDGDIAFPSPGCVLEYSVPNRMLKGAKVVEWKESARTYRDGASVNALVLQNQGMVFQLVARTNGQRVEISILENATVYKTDPTPEELEIVPFEPWQDENGFLVGGMNPPEAIAGFATTNGYQRWLQQTYNSNRDNPNRADIGAFMPGNSLPWNQRMNTTTMVLGLTHQELATPLLYALKLKEERAGTGWNGEFTLGGRPYRFNYIGLRGSPETVEIIALDDMETIDRGYGDVRQVPKTKLSFVLPAGGSAGNVDMIANYGCYPPGLTPHRIANMFGPFLADKLRRGLEDQRQAAEVALSRENIDSTLISKEVGEEDPTNPPIPPKIQEAMAKLKQFGLIISQPGDIARTLAYNRHKRKGKPNQNQRFLYFDIKQSPKVNLPIGHYGAEIENGKLKTVDEMGSVDSYSTEFSVNSGTVDILLSEPTATGQVTMTLVNSSGTFDVFVLNVDPESLNNAND